MFYLDDNLKAGLINYIGEPLLDIIIRKPSPDYSAYTDDRFSNGWFPDIAVSMFYMAIGDKIIKVAFDWYEPESGEVYLDYFFKEIKYDIFKDEEYETININKQIEQIEIYGREIEADLIDIFEGKRKFIKPYTEDGFVLTFTDRTKMMFLFGGLGPDISIVSNNKFMFVYNDTKYTLIDTIQG